MELEPRVVEAGSLKRWTKQALELVGRSFHAWFGLAVVLSLGAWFLEQLAYGASILLTTFGFALSSEIAAISDRQVLRISDFPDVVRAAVSQLIIEIRVLWLPVVLVVIVAPVLQFALYAWAIAYQAAHPTPPIAPVNYYQLTTWLFSQRSPFSASAWGSFSAATFYGYTRWRLGSLRYPLRRAFELSEEAAEALTVKAWIKNPQVSVNYSSFVLTMSMVAMVFLPILAPFLLCFLPALNYVAFREMFIDDKGNREPAKQSSTKPVMQGAF